MNFVGWYKAGMRQADAMKVAAKILRDLRPGN